MSIDDKDTSTMNLYKEFKKHNLYHVKTDLDGKKYNNLVANSRLRNFFFWFGKKSLGDFKDKNLNNLIHNFLKNKFEEEKNNKKYSNCNHLNIRNLYRQKIFWNYIKISMVFYVMPFLLLFTQNMKKFGYIRFIIFMPYLFSFKSLVNMVNEYNLKKNSVFYLYGIQYLYERDCEHKKIFEDYKQFIKENNLIFINEKEGKN